MPEGGANHITGEGICLKGEPITQGRPPAPCAGLQSSAWLSACLQCPPDNWRSRQADSHALLCRPAQGAGSVEYLKNDIIHKARFVNWMAETTCAMR
eukprot:8512038-Pyramimonas_sp.AAC.1